MRYVYVALGTFDGHDGFRPYLELGFVAARFVDNGSGAYTNENALVYFPAAWDGAATMFGLYLSADSELPIAFSELSDTMFLVKGFAPVVTGGRLIVEEELLAHSGEW